MLKAYKYRIYPTEQQQCVLTQQFGIGRFVYNWVLNQKQEESAKLKIWKQNPIGDKPKSRSAFDYCKSLTELKKQREMQWIGQANAQALQQEIAHFFQAYERFYARLKERKLRRQKLTHKNGKLLDFPKFKSRRNQQSLSFAQSVKVDFASAWVQIPKLGKVPCLFHREFTGTIKTTTLSKTLTGKYFVSILNDNSSDASVGVSTELSNKSTAPLGYSHQIRC